MLLKVFATLTVTSQDSCSLINLNCFKTTKFDETFILPDFSYNFPTHFKQH